MLTLGTGIGGGIVAGGRLLRGAQRRRGRDRPHGRRPRRAALPGRLPGPRADFECVRVGRARSAARGVRAALEQPDSALGRELAAGREITGALVTELAHDGDAVARDAIADVGRDARASGWPAS